ncbi:C45 family autoproteolytic acyltransferase/hydolase [Paraliomyxa miuraensis]|uniref:C45 family autoproteolytic acyltransferase/hydolase n=1 Tax=Paraliomyxa miuraensis TaxID=376150 RepID=UPI00225B6879|nr:C45 family peptidase [Paraliomyxa miuraensis]MCX4245428.1 C45 family peptidase [Paraliomyxa miuraensis]
MSVAEPSEPSDPNDPNGRGGHPLEPLLLSQDQPRARGRAHGEHWRQAIQELAELRWALIGRAGRLGGQHEGLAARPHLDALRQQLPALADELEGIAEGAALAPERVMALNQHGDPGTIVRASPGTPDAGAATYGDPGGGTVIYFHGVRGPLLGQTWDLHADAEPYVRVLRIAPAGGDREILCPTVAGCLGLGGISSLGVAVAMTPLYCPDRRVGVVWPAIVRAMLEQPDARAAYEQLRALPRSGARYCVMADGHDYYGVEASVQQPVLTQLGPRAAHLHTNHCFDPVLRKRESVPRSSSSFHRLNLATTLYAQQRPRDAEGLWSLLHTRDGSPGSLCIDPPGPGAAASSTATCAVVMMRLHDGWVRMVSGSAHRSPPLELGVERFVGQPGPVR